MLPYVAQKKMEKTFKILFKLSFVTISQFSIFVTFFSLKISFVALYQEPVNELIISIPFSVEKCQCITSNSRIIIDTEVVNCICIFLFAK